MSETTNLSETLEGLFTTPDYYWFVSYPAAVEGLTAEQANCSPGPRFNSIWAVTLHLNACQRFALAVLRGDPIDMAALFPEGIWPPVRNASESAWEQAKVDVLVANHDLAACIAGLADESLDRELPIGMKSYAFIYGHLAHNSHHLNEIISLRHMQGLWLEKT
jgi:hypothetical protein